MRQIFEFSTFLAGAAALHLAVGLIAADGAPDAGGSDGDAPVTLAAATPQMQAMVATWDRPVEIARDVAQPVAQTPVTRAMQPPTADQSVSRPLALSAPAVGAAPSVPQIDQRPAAAYKPRQRPKARPPAPPKPVARKVEKPKPRAQQAPSRSKSAPAAPAQKAAGNKSQANRGTAGAASASAAPSGNQQKILAQWGAQIRSSIERRKRFPAGTRGSGTVTLAISVHSRGALAGVSIRRSSGIAQIDNAALAAVRKARIAAAPRGLAAGVHSFTLPMKFAR